MKTTRQILVDGKWVDAEGLAEDPVERDRRVINESFCQALRDLRRKKRYQEYAEKHRAPKKRGRNG